MFICMCFYDIFVIVTVSKINNFITVSVTKPNVILVRDKLNETEIILEIIVKPERKRKLSSPCTLYVKICITSRECRMASL